MSLGSDRSCWVLIVKMQAAEGMCLEQVPSLLNASEEVDFKARNKEEIYDGLTQEL